ncbi:MAG: benzoylformate decarboxylase [Massilia sp.]|nr:benzoylformate decarboxylase [Massilia sp.]MDB5950087.1 benzoylformate decarboxylase [Massilia sp.]
MPTVRDAFFEVLRQLKLTTIFGNPGSTEESFLQDLPAGFRYVLALHEASVVAMADGYAQNTGEAVLVNLHTAAGIGNAMGNICTAWHNRTPMIILAGQQTRAMLLLEALLSNLQAVQLPKPYVKWSYETARPADAPAALLRAWAAAVQPPAGPVFLSIPMDDFDGPAAGVPAARRVSRALQASADDLRDTADALIAASNPILITGGALDQGEGGWLDAVRLAEALGCPVLAAPMEGRPGFPETHPQYQGVAPAAIGPLCESLQGHDVALVVGAPVFRYYPYVAGDYLPPGMRLIQVSDDPEATARAPVGDSILADPARACRVLADLVAQSGRAAVPPPALKKAAPEPKPAPAAPAASDRISADSLFHTLAGLRPADSIIVEESLSNLKALRARLPTARPRSFFSASSGVLGYALPAAAGVALAERDRGSGRKVICLLGDGAAQYTIQGLWNAARLRLPILFVVLRNREYAILKSFAEMEETPAVPGLDLPGLDCVRLAEGYGCAAGRVDDPEALADALRDGLARAGPYLLEVAIDAEVPPLL